MVSGGRRRCLRFGPENSLSWFGPFHWQPILWYLQCVGRSRQSYASWRSRDLYGNSTQQYWHSDGSSETAFSTARFLDALLLDISTRQFGHVATWSRKLWRFKFLLFNFVGNFLRSYRPSANKWVKQAAHIRWPIWHWKERVSGLVFGLQILCFFYYFH